MILSIDRYRVTLTAQLATNVSFNQTPDYFDYILEIHRDSPI